MREIKFRVWSNDKMYLPVTSLMHPKQYHNGTGFGTLVFLFYPEMYLRDEDYIVMQYTGLKDKNGKEIYENDVVKDQWGGIHKIVFEYGCFYAKNKDPEESINPYHKESIIEVIGNIYSNPELL